MRACLQLTTGYIDDKCPADPGNTNTKYGNYPTLLNLPITPATNYCAAPAGVPYCVLGQQESWSAYRCVLLNTNTQSDPRIGSTSSKSYSKGVICA